MNENLTVQRQVTCSNQLNCSNVSVSGTLNSAQCNFQQLNVTDAVNLSNLSVYDDMSVACSAAFNGSLTTLDLRVNNNTVLNTLQVKQESMFEGQCHFLNGITGDLVNG